MTFKPLCVLAFTVISTNGGENIPRLFGPAVHETSPNDLPQLHHVDLGGSNNGDKYALMLRNDHSDYTLFCFFDTCAENGATDIIEWCTLFGVAKLLMSNGRAHLSNKDFRLVSIGLNIPRRFTLVYCLGSNGAV